MKSDCQNLFPETWNLCVKTGCPKLPFFDFFEMQKVTSSDQKYRSQRKEKYYLNYYLTH